MGNFAIRCFDARLAVMACAALGCPLRASEPAPLLREAIIPLGRVIGRLDHLAVNLAGHRLFVAELGSDSVGVVDVNRQRLLTTLTGLKEPQGLGYSATTDELFVANGGDGSVSIFGGAALSLRGAILLGDDADNVRIGKQAAQLVVGYGQGGLAIIDPISRRRLADVKLKGHPEGFDVLPDGQRVLVNVPAAREIAVVDVRRAVQVAAWPLADWHGNFPLAIDEGAQTVWVVTRQPAKLIAMDGRSGIPKLVLNSCDDADDVLFDAVRHRLYVICGTGFIDVWEIRADHYEFIAHQRTMAGARTALFVPGWDRLYLAVRAGPGSAAAIWVYRPTSQERAADREAIAPR